ncbi:MAG: undecaprenyl-diphosphatase [Candidatus Dojkabacteria bacterium]|nr:MAG: undecaprenyl-diphosphatase [Candidatus Dojkabacteria bacterium]
MNFLDVAILAIVQGATEFIPVSSSGHVLLVYKLLNIEKESANTINLFLHLGTFIAVIIYYQKKIMKFLISVKKFILKSKLKRKEEENLKIIKLLIIASIPVSVVGVLFDSFVENFYEKESFEVVLILSFSFVALGITYIFAPFFYPSKKTSLKNLGFKRAFIVGIGQSLALFYGISRSGMSIVSSKMVGLNTKDAVDFAFLLSIPSIGGGIFWKILTDYKSISAVDFDIILSAVIISFVSGYLAIEFLINFLKHANLRIFGLYMIFIGLITILIL